MYNKLFDFLKKIKHPVVFNLGKGLMESEIKSLEIKYNVSLPMSLKELYTLCNGVSSEGKVVGELSIFPNGILLTLDEALNAFKINHEYSYWEKTYFPIYANGDGDFILIQLAPEDDYNRIYFYSPSHTGFKTIISLYDTEGLMIDTIIKCYEKGAYFIQNEVLQVNFNLETQISKVLNPLSEYWKIFEKA